MEFPLFENRRKRLRWLAGVWGLLLLAYGLSYFYFDGFISIFTLTGGLLGSATWMAGAYKKAVLTEAELVLQRYLGRPQRIPYGQIYRLKRNPYSDKPELDLYYGAQNQLSLRSRQLDALEAALRRRLSSAAEDKAV